jgi:hypothetical protein
MKGVRKKDQQRDKVVASDASPKGGGTKNFDSRNTTETQFAKITHTGAKVTRQHRAKAAKRSSIGMCEVYIRECVIHTKQLSG